MRKVHRATVVVSGEKYYHRLLLGLEGQTVRVEIDQTDGGIEVIESWGVRFHPKKIAESILTGITCRSRAYEPVPKPVEPFFEDFGCISSAPERGKTRTVRMYAATHVDDPISL